MSSRALEERINSFGPRLISTCQKTNGCHNNVMQQCRFSLAYGCIDDLKAGIAALVEKLIEAGTERAMEEMQSRLSVYPAKQFTD